MSTYPNSQTLQEFRWAIPVDFATAVSVVWNTNLIGATDEERQHGIGRPEHPFRDPADMDGPCHAFARRESNAMRSAAYRKGIKSHEVNIVNTTATCTCGWVTTQGTTDRTIIVSAHHLKCNNVEKKS